jgi:IS1 family transposase
MRENSPSCIRFGVSHFCPVCKSEHLIKSGKTANGKQRYRYLITKKLHNTHVHSTNHIERHNLSIRTHLKRLNRKTICFSRSLVVLMAVLKIYFWS